MQSFWPSLLPPESNFASQLNSTTPVFLLLSLAQILIIIWLHLQSSLIKYIFFFCFLFNIVYAQSIWIDSLKMFSLYLLFFHISPQSYLPKEDFVLFQNLSDFILGCYRDIQSRFWARVGMMSGSTLWMDDVCGFSRAP